MPIFEADHPLRLLHPRSGRPILLLTEFHAHRVLELEPEASERLIAELKAHLYAPERVYLHRWRLWDFLILDNLALQHARTEEAPVAQGARALQRVQISDAYFPDLIARAREQQRQRELEGRA